MTSIEQAIDDLLEFKNLEKTLSFMLESPHVADPMLVILEPNGKKVRALHVDMYVEYISDDKIRKELYNMWGDVAAGAGAGSGTPKDHREKIWYSVIDDKYYTLVKSDKYFIRYPLISKHEKYVPYLDEAALDAANDGREVYMYKRIKGNYNYVHGPIS